jgi:lysophospholipid acyltransferase (LPLAT)-like uncharacterized protein
MREELQRPITASRAAARSRRESRLRSAWRAIRRPLVQSRFVKSALASALATGLRFIRWTNPLADKDFDIDAAYAQHSPAIIALWHGQHLLIPFYYPRGKPLVIMVSRSADAEMNALVVEKIGMQAVRGSGGREQTRHLEKGGARALIALKKALDAGKNVAMIADIPHGTPREAGLGIVTLARLSGRKILPLAMATTRRKVVEKSWDKTTISLPFGRAALVVGETVSVPADADDAVMEEKRRELTASLNAATAEAYRMVDKQS